MSAALTRYEAYQVTGLPWVGRCPAHWSLERMKYLVHERVEKGYPAEPLLTASQTRGVISKADYGSRTVEAQKDLHLLKLVEPGDYVISLRSFQGGIEFAHVRGIISPAYTVLEPKSVVRRGYFEHFFKSANFINSMTLFVTGIREGQNIDYVRLSRAYMPVPPPEEQDAIGRFISHLDLRVNRLIKTKRRLIELMYEQKQAIIHRAVSRGLDPNVPFKSSGIDWLGEVPEHWRMMRICHVADMLVSNVDKHSHEHEEPVRLCNYVDVYKNEAITDQLKFMVATASKDEVLRFRVQIGDVIITKDSELWSDIGVPAVVRHQADDLVCGYHLAILRPNASELSGEFLLRCLQDRLIATQLHIAANGTTRYGLSQGSIKSCLIPVPPFEEQGHLVTHLMEATRDLTLAISKTQAEIDLIREHRTRLVADVVTGQLDVRHLDLPEFEESLIEAIDAGDGDELEDSVEDEEAGE